jgi:hypothetical protein
MPLYCSVSRQNNWFTSVGRTYCKSVWFNIRGFLRDEDLWVFLCPVIIEPHFTLLWQCFVAEMQRNSMRVWTIVALNRRQDDSAFCSHPWRNTCTACLQIAAQFVHVTVVLRQDFGTTLAVNVVQDTNSILVHHLHCAFDMLKLCDMKQHKHWPLKCSADQWRTFLWYRTNQPHGNERAMFSSICIHAVTTTHSPTNVARHCYISTLLICSSNPLAKARWHHDLVVL